MRRVVKNLVMSLLGIAVLVVAFFVAYSFIRSPEPYSLLISDAVKIRTVGNNSITKARIIDDIDKNIGRVKETAILEKWDEITSCLNEGCADDSLFDFVLSIVISRPDKVPNSKLIANIIVAGRFWGSQEVLKFSKALTAANEAIDKINAKDVEKKWDEIIACDGKCVDKNNLVFEEILLVVSKGNQK